MEYWQLRTGISGIVFWVICEDHDDFKTLVEDSGLVNDPGKNYGQEFDDIPIDRLERGIYREDGREFYIPQ